MIRLKRYLIACIVLFICATQANAKSDFGSIVRDIFSIPQPKPAIEKSAPETFREITENVNEKISEINSEAAMLDITTTESFLSIVSLLSSSGNLQQIKSKIGLIQYDPTLTDMEKSIAVNDIISDFQANLTENQTSYVNVIKKLSPANKKTLIEKIMLLSDNGEKYINLGRKSAKTAKKYLAQTFEGDDRTETVGEINSITGRHTQRAQALTYFIRELKSIARQAGLSL